MYADQDILYTLALPGTLYTWPGFSGSWATILSSTIGGAMLPGVRIDYKALRKTSAAAARQAVLAFLASCGGNVAATARAFGITRPTVYAIQSKGRGGDLRDASRAPKTRPRQTTPEVEAHVVAAKRRTRLGSRRRHHCLRRYEALEVPWTTIRHIVRRHHDELPGKGRRRAGTARPFVDWYSAKPFEIVQMDLKYIRDHKALSLEQIAHLDAHGIPCLLSTSPSPRD